MTFVEGVYDTQDSLMGDDQQLDRHRKIDDRRLAVEEYQLRYRLVMSFHFDDDGFESGDDIEVALSTRIPIRELVHTAS